MEEVVMCEEANRNYLRLLQVRTSIVDFYDNSVFEMFCLPNGFYSVLISLFSLKCITTNQSLW